MLAINDGRLVNQHYLAQGMIINLKKIKNVLIDSDNNASYQSLSLVTPPAHPC